MDRSGHGRICLRAIEYNALPSQARFHRSAARFKGFSGPIGSGKSQALCQEAIRLTYLNPGRQGLIGAPTFPMLRDATQAALFELMEKNHLPFDYNKAENVATMRDTGSKILFRPVDEFERLRGTNLAWFGIDELTYCPEEAWLRLEGRLRDPKATHLCGFAVWTPKGFDWVYRRFVDAPVEGYEVILAQPFENRHLLRQIPDFYERLKNSYDSRFFQQEVMGQYLNTQSGLVYHCFDRATHVTDVQLEARQKLLWALDFNVEPMSSVIVQKSRDKVVVLDEIVLHRATTLEACQEFQARYPRHDAGVIVYGDASGSHMQTGGSSDYEIIRQFFRREGYPNVDYRVPKSNPNVRDRISLTNTKLRSAAGGIDLFVSPKCKELIKDFEQVCYKEASVIVDKLKDPNRTHLSDALGYLIWQECRPQAPVGERDKPLLCF
jgi:hypothetical protein